jgi:L-iditol 2-dehydrogenase
VCGSDLHSFGEGGIGDAMLAAPLVLGHVHLGDDVAVIGCGPIGLLLVQVARAAGARVVLAVDPLAHRRAAAERAGAARALSPEEVPGGVDADVTFEVAGTDAAVELAIRAGRPGARVVLAGIPGDDRTSFPAGAARRKGLTLVLVRRMGDPTRARSAWSRRAASRWTGS